MSDIPKWLEELRQQQGQSPQGRVAVLREIVRCGEARTIDGVEIAPATAEMMLRVYECLPAALQERWAAACNADFRSCLGQSLALEAAEPLAQLIFGSQGGTEEAEKARAKLSEIFSGLLGDSGHAEITVKVVKVDPPPRKENPDGG